MIKLKTEVNKSAIMRELRKEAESMYDSAYEGEYAIEQFLNGAEALFKKLRIANVVGRSEQLPHPDCDEACYYHCTKGGTQMPPDCVK